MRVLCLFQTFDFSSSTIYLDLVEALRDGGHDVWVAAGTSKKELEGKTEEIRGVHAVYVFIPDQFRTDRIRKGLIQLTIGQRMYRSLKGTLSEEKFDIIVYPTPPVTLGGLVKKLKTLTGAGSYLMLKDIFPQNAVDLKMMRENGLLHRYFRKREKELYAASDRIGCMSAANVEYMKAHNPETADRLEIFPNTVRLKPLSEREGGKGRAPVKFVFGGNLGVPQSIDFLLECIEGLGDYKEAVFEIYGEGTQREKVEEFVFKKRPENLRFVPSLPREEYEKKLMEADVGIVALSPDFTIPNYPSRILSYMQMAKPVLALTDPVTDIHALVTYEARCGWWCPSDDVGTVVETVKKICSERESIPELGKNGRMYLEENFDVKKSVELLERFAAEK
ncbi:MAG: glycosyltransferase family 4 protein [Lachnospiraceae bacterium]|nr:glycosyltransferase family 4 protein [Lachnospiraceae bacterium]